MKTRLTFLSYGDMGTGGIELSEEKVSLKARSVSAITLPNISMSLQYKDTHGKDTKIMSSTFTIQVKHNIVL